MLHFTNPADAPQFSCAATTKAAYSYFTLDEWHRIADGVRQQLTAHTPQVERDAILALLTKMPSAVL
jgi:hypothetical protein